MTSQQDFSEEDPKTWKDVDPKATTMAEVYKVNISVIFSLRTLTLCPIGSPLGDPGPLGDLFGDLGPLWVPFLDALASLETTHVSQ